MSYCLERDESIASGIRRVVAGQIESAIAVIEDGAVPSVAAVHEVRKSCKRIRAALRLVRHDFGDYRLENTQFRDLARAISDVRDLQVLPESHRLLAGLLPDDSNQAGIEVAATAIGTCVDGKLGARDQTIEESLTVVRKGLKSALKRVGTWEIKSLDSDGPVRGLRNTYRRAKGAIERCLDDPVAANLHEWRKQAKYHWYHLSLVAESWPEAREQRGASAERLAEMLGEDHDLANYARVLEEIRAQLPEDVLAALRACVQRRREALGSDSFALGAQLFSAKPESFARRFQFHWRDWKNG